MATILDIWEEGDRESSEESSMRGPVRTGTMHFSCQVAEGSETISHAEIKADSRVPKRNDTCPWDSVCVCRKIDVRQDGDFPQLFKIDVFYSNQPLGGEEPDRTDDDNPLNHAADISWDSEEVREALTKDLDNKRIVNSAGQRFETAVEAVRRRRVITVVKNLETWNDSIAIAFEECVNSAAFLGYAARTVMCKKIAARRVFSSNMYYFQVTFIFVWDRLGWKTRVVDIGRAKAITFDVNGNASEWEAFTDNSGIPLTSDVLLNGSGAKLTAATPYIHEFRVHNEANFASLPLGI